MKPKLFLCLALVLSGGLSGCSTIQNHPAGLPVRYHNAQYDFTFYLPASWRGYSVLIRQLDDERYSPAADKPIIVGHSPMITLRNPRWQASAAYQDIPIVAFTRAQWDALHHGRLWPSLFAGGMMEELWHNQRFVFALSSRTFGFDDELKEWRETEDIVNRNCAIHSAPHLYPE